MSFNNLSFNISKSTATTSTSIEDSTWSNTSSGDKDNLGPSGGSDVTDKSNGGNFIHGMLAANLSPKISVDPVAGVSEDKGKKDLIELFDKYEIEVEDKFEQFKENVRDEGVLDEKAALAETEETAEPVEEAVEPVEEVIEPIKAPAEEPMEESVEEPEPVEAQAEVPVEAPVKEPEPVEEPAEKPVDSTTEEAIVSPTEPTDDSVQPFQPSQPKDFRIDEIEEDEQSAIEQHQLTPEEMKSHPLHRPEIRSRSLSQVNIDPSEQYQQSHKPFNFHNFLEQLKKKPADPIARYIRSFLIAFNKQSLNLTLQQKVKIVKDFKIFMSEKFQLFEPFMSMDDTDLENSREGLEKLIMNRIYTHCFPPEIIKTSLPINLGLVSRDLNDDKLFTKQLDKFSWINGQHLDVDLDKLGSNHDFMDYAIKEFQKINTYRAPRDKIICILNACKIIFGFLKVNNQETNADAFMPILIIIIIKSKVDHLISNMHYIENFRSQEWLGHGETSYYLSSLQGAVNFIENIEFGDLSISQEEFDAHMEAWEADQKIKVIKPQPIDLPQPISQPANQALSPSQVLFTSAEMFTKSISNFLSPSPQGSPGPDTEQDEHHQLLQQQRKEIQQQKLEIEQQKKQEELINQTFDQLLEIIPTLDKNIMKDIVTMNKGDMDLSLDACLQLVSD